MKMTELKCTACNGTLKIDKDHPNIAVCEYCQTKYVIEDEGNDQIHISPAGPSWPSPPPHVFTPQKTSGITSWIWLGIVALCFFIIITIISISNFATNHTPDAGYTAASLPYTPFSSDPYDKPQEAPAPELTGILASMVNQVYGKPVGDVTEEELAKIQWLAVRYTIDDIRLGYSFDDPEQTSSASLTWMTFPEDSGRADPKQLEEFTGLKVLDWSGSLPDSIFQKLSLESLSCHSDSPAKLANAMGDKAGQLKELDMNGSINTLEGLSQFTGLESLTLYGYDLTDLKDLAGMKWLKSLTLESCDNVTDFSVLSVMTWLNSLSVDSKNIRDIGFLSHMTDLTSFTLSGAKVLTLKPLSQLPNLASLSVTKCYDMKDCSSISSLKGLTSLTLQVPYECKEPALTNQTGLKYLSLNGVKNVNYLKKMAALEDLTLINCEISDSSVFAGLTSLKSLTYSQSIGDQTKWNFVNKIPSLESLNLTKVSSYSDISSIFLHPTLQEININGMECELNFSKLKPNPALKTLKMDGVVLYKNIQVYQDAGMTSVYYDDVTLDDHTDFLKNFPGLTTLSIGDNKLTKLSFADGLPALTTLNIRNNYITDLKPLTAITTLKTVDCTGNPIENYRVLSEDVTIIK